MGKTIAIIGAGLAGTACAYVLARRGYVPIIVDAAPSLAAGASGNEWGLYNPRISADLTPHGWYYKGAFERALETFNDLSAHDSAYDIGHTMCGALHFITNDKKQIRYTKALKNWGLNSNSMRIVSKNKGSKIAGVLVKYDALYLPQSGYVSPRKLCHAYARGVEVRLNTIVKNINDLKRDLNADHIIIANGMGALDFDICAALPLRPVRGQTTMLKASAESGGLKTALCYGGYCLPAMNGAHMIGATFERGNDASVIKDSDDVYNIETLNAAIPALGLRGATVQKSWAGVRATSKHHTPIIKRLSDDTYISTAHGSHGIISTIMAAHMIADNIQQGTPIKPL